MIGKRCNAKGGAMLFLSQYFGLLLLVLLALLIVAMQMLFGLLQPNLN
jgi:hypothetical protein